MKDKGVLDSRSGYNETGDLTQAQKRESERLNTMRLTRLRKDED